MKTEPILILESENEEDYLNFRIAYWGLGQEKYYYKTIARLSYQEIVQESAQLAQSLSHLSDRTWAKEQLDYSIYTLLQLRQVGSQGFTDPLEAMQSAIRIEDEAYCQKLREYFQLVNDRQNILCVEKLLDAIANLKHKRTLESVNISHTLTGHSQQVTSVAISCDRKTLVSGSTDKTINVWNLKTGRIIHTLTENLGEVSSLAVSPDGNFLTVGSWEHPKSNVKVWHLQTGNESSQVLNLLPLTGMETGNGLRQS